jgi:hypothetical protein
MKKRLRKNRLGVGLLGLLALAAPAAQAAQSPMAVQFAGVLQNAGHRQVVMEAAKQSPAWTHMACSAASFTQVPEVAVYVPVLFDKAGAPISGEWREGVIASGCGTKVILNVLTKITAPSTLSTGFILPGATIADPILQNYAQSFALKAAGGLPAGCKDGFVADTEFAGYAVAGPTGESGAWKEIWTLDLCGVRRRVVVHFVPDATGTTINAEPATPPK